MTEEWRAIKGFEGFYEVSNFGRVRSVERVEYQRHPRGGMSRYVHPAKMLKILVRPNGYTAVDLRRQGRAKRISVHRLVALHFLERENGKDYVNHLDMDKTNNRADNLEWCTQSANVQYSYDVGAKIPPNQKRVMQCDLEGNPLKEWPNMTEASRALGIPQSNISKVCRGERKKAGGFIWRFIQ